MNKYNILPLSIWEPPLDIEVPEDDEKTYLEEAQILVNKVNEAEKALAPKPLQTIALPKPLVDYTWLCLTETIVYIHQYLTDEGLVRLKLLIHLFYYKTFKIKIENKECIKILRFLVLDFDKFF